MDAKTEQFLPKNALSSRPCPFCGGNRWETYDIVSGECCDVVYNGYGPPLIDIDVDNSYSIVGCKPSDAGDHISDICIKCGAACVF